MTQQSQFKKAVKGQSRLRFALAGPAGSGKTLTSLAIATALHPGKVAVIDTENGSAEKYAKRFDFDVINVKGPFHPDRFCSLVDDAVSAGYQALIGDSITHFYNGPGGLLELVDQVAARMQSPNSFAAWKEVTPIQNRLVRKLMEADIDILVTLRSKMEYVLEEDDKGKKQVRKVGLKPEQRGDFEYEFDIFGEMDASNRLIISKSRATDELPVGSVFTKPDGKEIAERLQAFLSGVERPKIVDAETLREFSRLLAQQGGDKEIAIKLAQEQFGKKVNELTVTEFQKIREQVLPVLTTTSSNA